MPTTTLHFSGSIANARGNSKQFSKLPKYRKYEVKLAVSNNPLLIQIDRSAARIQIEVGLPKFEITLGVFQQGLSAGKSVCALIWKGYKINQTSFINSSEKALRLREVCEHRFAGQRVSIKQRLSLDHPHKRNDNCAGTGHLWRYRRRSKAGASQCKLPALASITSGDPKCHDRSARRANRRNDIPKALTVGWCVHGTRCDPYQGPDRGRSHSQKDKNLHCASKIDHACFPFLGGILA